ncbi:dienelactone hydrolase family protein [Frankia sp. Cas4]|uniref:dienelactone hydrolase family protein n=1 Tax=Frankia sp. Cas4 TaxID=3073927 RepID=UPI003A0FBED5
MPRTSCLDGELVGEGGEVLTRGRDVLRLAEVSAEHRRGPGRAGRRRGGRAPQAVQRRPAFTVGFCFGGSQSWQLAASSIGLHGVVGFYGQPRLVRDVLPAISTPMLLLAAGEDVLRLPRPTQPATVRRLARRLPSHRGPAAARVAPVHPRRGANTGGSRAGRGPRQAVGWLYQPSVSRVSRSG